jgi:kynureninase
MPQQLAYKATRDYAQELDDADEFSHCSDLFAHPKRGKKKLTYFCGNSLGLQPLTAKEFIQQELADWAQHGVEGHFEAQRPWFKYHHYFTKSLAKLVGARDTEVVAMNTLTVNLQLLMLSFYKPTATRYKIIMEAGAFPSDMYAVETLVKYCGLKPKDAIIEIAPHKGEYLLHEQDILDTIKLHGKSVAMVMLGGVHYYTGQLHNMEAITTAAHAVGAYAGFDLAHAVGNVPLELHNWGVDFACWCSYKYLNSGPGAVAGAYIHEQYATSTKTPRLSGWWGHNEKTRFQMQKGYDPMPNAQSWQMSNAPVLNMAAHRASLDIFDQYPVKKLRGKSELLTGFAHFLLKHLTNVQFEIITPADAKQRGCQLSLLFAKDGKKIFDHLTQNYIIADWREPNVIRVAPTPLYNSFQDVFELYEVLKSFK